MLTKIDLFIEKKERENLPPIYVCFFMYKNSKVYLKGYEFSFTQFALQKEFEKGVTK